MSSPLVKITDRPVWLAPQYFGSIAYYAALAMHARAVVDTGLRYDKRRKSVHRCEIIDTRARLMLTVPVSRPKDVSLPTLEPGHRVASGRVVERPSCVARVGLWPHSVF